jgi:hypothetical protein
VATSITTVTRATVIVTAMVTACITWMMVMSVIVRVIEIRKSIGIESSISIYSDFLDKRIKRKKI